MIMKTIISVIICLLTISSCSWNSEAKNMSRAEPDLLPPIKPYDIKIERQLLYDKHTLPDIYPYKDTIRVFQWEKIRSGLILIDSIQQNKPLAWAILQNNKNTKGAAPSARKMIKNKHNQDTDMYGTQRYQSIPLFLPDDKKLAERYGRDGSLVRYMGLESDSSDYAKIETINFDGEWLVPNKYIKLINDTVTFKKAIFIDKTNQNIMTLEKVDSVWYIRSMNPATTGLHKPPYKYETPSGIFVIQQKVSRMNYLKDGTDLPGGYAPYASRFSNGGYIHGVPIDLPRTQQVEFSPSLGTTPRSHMCVRNATSHAKYVYDWAPVDETIVMIFD